jgi:hypothetical protein
MTEQRCLSLTEVTKSDSLSGQAVQRTMKKTTRLSSDGPIGSLVVWGRPDGGVCSGLR